MRPANAVDRNATSVQRNDTFIAMQQGGDASWSIAVPSGNYSMYIVAGDPSASGDRMQITAQGQIVLSGVTKRSRQYLEGTAIVNVNNGQLKISSGPDAVNNKIDYVVITAAHRGAEQYLCPRQCAGHGRKAQRTRRARSPSRAAAISIRC